jgi:hypothetical protein
VDTCFVADGQDKDAPDALGAAVGPTVGVALGPVEAWVDTAAG